MKTTLTVLFTTLLALASVAKGDSYRTLNGYQDSITIPAGQTALIVSATSEVVVGVTNPGRREFQYRFALGSNDFHTTRNITTRRNINLLPTPSFQNPVPIAGPAKLILRTSGLITLSLPEKRHRTSTTSSHNAVRRFAKN